MIGTKEQVWDHMLKERIIIRNGDRDEYILTEKGIPDDKLIKSEVEAAFDQFRGAFPFRIPSLSNPGKMRTCNTRFKNDLEAFKRKIYIPLSLDTSNNLSLRERLDIVCEAIRLWYREDPYAHGFQRVILDGSWKSYYEALINLRFNKSTEGLKQLPSVEGKNIFED